jgi:hypothetical protein
MAMLPSQRQLSCRAYTITVRALSHNAPDIVNGASLRQANALNKRNFLTQAKGRSDSAG